jgi:dihydrofolate synthase/folylpolyglutamate synthase
MTYKESLDYLYAQLPMYHRVGAVAYKKDLHNTLALCAHLGHPQHQFPAIHIGGTNGKGSVSHIIAAALQASGLKTGLYVSPHYKDFRERIKINGEYIPRRQVQAFVEQNKSIIEEIAPSFFELCVAMAFDHFAREKVDIAVIEVGLGGRLDSTNVITPLLSVITNISYDHMNLLGDTLPQIAFEKAGIIKANVPVVIGETHPESAPVFIQKAREMNAPITFADQHYKVEALQNPQVFEEKPAYSVQKEGVYLFESLPVDIAGPYQSNNLATAFQAWEVFEGVVKQHPHLALRSGAFEDGVQSIRARTRFQGRWQLIGNRPTILCDSAHNEAGLKAAFGKIKDLDFGRLHIITGMVNDKDVDKALGYFPADARYYFAKANIPRGLDTRVLQEKAQAFGLVGKPYKSVKGALAAAKRAAKPDDLIIVIGSIFVVAEVI